ncbi:MAG: alpha/beta hydrolase [Lautropia sp.]
MRLRPRPIAFALACMTLGACSVGGVLKWVTPGNGARTTGGIAFGPDPRHRLDVWAPPDAAAAPVVVFFYGGSWRGGERATYAFVGKALAARGIVTVVPDYRVYPQVRYPGFLRDAASAVAWTFREIAAYGGDPQRVFVMGHSAGAYNAAMLALDPRWLEHEKVDRARLRGWIGLAGPYDFLPIENPDVKPVFFHPDYPPATQPIGHADAGAPPTFLGAAANDTLVDPVRNTDALARRLREAGVAVTLRHYPSAGHMSLVAAFAGPLHPIAAVLEDTAAFVHAQRGTR